MLAADWCGYCERVWRQTADELCRDNSIELGLVDVYQTITKLIRI